MSQSIKVIYGSTTGNTQRAAEAIAAGLGGTAVSAADAVPDDFKADLLILGSSTWGCGELQDDWQSALPMLEAADLSGRKVALFGLGDAVGFADTYLNAMGEIGDIVKAAGGILIGAWESAGYPHSASTAEENGHFIGLALDDDNEPGETAGRIGRWCAQLKTEAGLRTFPTTGKAVSPTSFRRTAFLTKKIHSPQFRICFPHE